MLNQLSTVTKHSTREQTRQRILMKADELFRQTGYAKTTIADIAAGLDMSLANIYQFFPCKEAIIQAKAERHLTDLKRSVEAIACQRWGALDRIESLVVTVSHWHSERLPGEPPAFKLVLLASAQHWGCMRAFRIFLMTRITDLIKEGVESGEFHVSDPGAAAQMLIDCLELALSPRAAEDPSRRLTEERVRAQVRFLGKALR
jgi:AcrR family transcriptional regulator